MSPLRWFSHLAAVTVAVASSASSSAPGASADAPGSPHDGHEEIMVNRLLRGSSTVVTVGPISPPPAGGGPKPGPGNVQGRQRQRRQQHQRDLDEHDGSGSGSGGQQQQQQYPTVSHRIIGGTQVPASTTYPFMVALYRGGVHWCGASVISPDFLITAGHCSDVDSGRIGSNDKSDGSSTNSNVVAFTIDDAQKTWHQQYSLAGYLHDVMLIRLTTPLNITDFPPIAVNTDPAVPAAGQALTTMGWGQLKDGSKPNLLQEVSVDYVPQGTCLSAFNGDYVTDDMMCAIAPDRDACQGDSGGPIIVPASATTSSSTGATTTITPPTLVGTVSWGFNCDSGFPGVYSRMSDSAPWIAAELCARSVDPPAWARKLAGCAATGYSSGTGPSPTAAATTAAAPSSSTTPAPAAAYASPLALAPAPTNPPPTTTPPPPPPPTPTPIPLSTNPSTIKILFKFDRHPEDIGWSVSCGLDGQRSTLASAHVGTYADISDPDSYGNYEANPTVVLTETVPIPVGTPGNCVVTIVDDWNDGFCVPGCSGHYVKVYHAIDDGTGVETQVGDTLGKEFGPITPSLAYFSEETFTVSI